MKLITPLTIVNKNFHAMDLIREEIKNRRLAIESFSIILKIAL